MCPGNEPVAGPALRREVGKRSVAFIPETNSRLCTFIKDMTIQLTGNPKFGKHEVVKVSLYDSGRLKDDLARKAIPYDGQVGAVIGRRYYSILGRTGFVFNVKMNDGNLIRLSEDCLEKLIVT